MEPLPPMCVPSHNKMEFAISVFLAVGMLASYLPQHFKILLSKTSEGFSPWFLLLGSISCASSFLNVLVLQFPIVLCCRYLSSGDCFENILGIIQVGIQWSMFAIILILYIIYFPQHKKTTRILNSDQSVQTPDWRHSILVTVLVAAHFVLSLFVSIWVLSSFGPASAQANLWAGFLGLLSTTMATLQYIPQIHRTWRLKAVGALSIPMMLMQTPGAFLFAYSIYLRPGTNWTSWMTFVASGTLQGTLLIMCLVWTFHKTERVSVGTTLVHNPLDIKTERTALLSNPMNGEPSYM
ncbi:hypothetical protein K493DRAFT_275462 [Basidiobolus meristosporus CBS 931.73]|uniref:PQ-loop-domain-containing protein n=1 Tax=Basidiobolus meristosporus CBS 931.73 TaxID=1314790 RepID=A0A1Y1Z3R4_9FUNG|nr:hypothetical protein K493DRAFT_275462 [Basidiobolus meristosporus CBS 931.73]|eukprot:ORY04902.1 hypothetical protein K493DRAFT_275462 [Basidiobolus meristosporus CBS 931.73]